LQQFINGISIGGAYALLGIGVTLVWGILGVLTFAQAQIMTWGAFGALVTLNTGFPPIVAVLAGLVVAGTISMLIDVVLFAPLRARRAPEFAFTIVTIGAAQILATIASQRTDAQTLVFPRAGFPTGTIEVFGSLVPKLNLVMLIISLVALVALTYWLNRTRSGRAVRTLAHSHETGELLGVNSRAIFAQCFFLAGVLAALSGIFLAIASAQLNYSSNDPLLLVAFAVIVLGGMGSIRGAIVGGMVLGLIYVYATVYISSVFRDVTSFAVILLVLVLRPSGLFGEKAVTRV
jgi:branched-chain amino acid transport system permease protein